MIIVTTTEKIGNNLPNSYNNCQVVEAFDTVDDFKDYVHGYLRDNFYKMKKDGVEPPIPHTEVISLSYAQKVDYYTDMTNSTIHYV